MKTAFNPQRQNFVKYDDKHYLLFLNETEAEQTNEQGETVKGFTSASVLEPVKVMCLTQPMTGWPFSSVSSCPLSSRSCSITSY